MLTLENAIKELSKNNAFFQRIYILSSLEEHSQQILGVHISKHAHFKDYKDGTLHIECDDYIWATELKKMTRQIKKRIYEKLQINIEKIDIGIQKSDSEFRSSDSE